MLAKQAWRLITAPNSLLSRVMKAKYYPDSDFLEARWGGQPSYAWRSIVASRELIRKGIRWRVGDGKGINIASDPWLPRPFSYKLISPPMKLAGTATVNELLRDDGRSWNEELIEAEFREEDAACIKSIELRFPGASDDLEWHFGRKGRFSVKSAYELCLQQLAEDGSSSTHVQDKDPRVGWQFLWRAKVPPKVKLMAWRACRDAIPVSCNLRRRGISISTLCMRCGLEQEDVLHVLLRCSFSRQVWALSCLPWRWINLAEGTTEDWMRSVWKELTGADFSLFLLICWNLWWSRNQLAFEAIALLPWDIVVSARRLLLISHKDPMVTDPLSNSC